MEVIKSAGQRQFPIGITDPQPLQKFEGMWRVAAQAATIGIFFFAVIAAIEYARPVLLPVVSAFMIGMMLGPLSNIAKKAGIPSFVSAVFFWLLVIGFFYGVVVLLSGPLVEWTGKGPQL